MDVSIEMSGATAALNTAIAAAGRGGHVILFGIRSGDAVIEHIDRVIVYGISLHSVVGRRIWETWHITRNLLESHTPDIQRSIFDTILNRGRDCVLPVSDFDQERFARLIDTYPKMILDWR